MTRPPPRLTEGHTASRSARQWRTIASRFGNGSASIFSNGTGGGAATGGGTATAGGWAVRFFSGFGAAVLGGGGEAGCFGVGAATGGGAAGGGAGGGAAAAGGGDGGGGGAAFAAGGGGEDTAAGGVTALTALLQAGDNLAMCWRRQSSASLPPRGTPEQFDRKSERQEERMALNCSSLGFCACAADPRQTIAAITAAAVPHFD